MYLEKNRECAIQEHARQPHLQGVLSEKHRRYENTSTTKYVAMNPRQCVGCLKCVDKCPKHVIGKVCFLWHKHVVFKDADACIGCNKCVKTCPHGVFSQQSSKIWETPRFGGNICPDFGFLFYIWNRQNMHKKLRASTYFQDTCPLYS